MRKGPAESPSLAEDEESEPTKRLECLKLVTFHRCSAKTKGEFYSSDQSVLIASFSAIEALCESFVKIRWLLILPVASFGNTFSQ